MLHHPQDLSKQEKNKKVVPAPTFDTAQGEIAKNSGLNRLTGSVDANTSGSCEDESALWTETDGDGRRQTQTDADGRRRRQTGADGRRRTQTDADGRRRTQTDADGCRRVQTDADGRRRMQTDEFGESLQYYAFIDLLDFIMVSIMQLQNGFHSSNVCLSINFMSQDCKECIFYLYWYHFFRN